jgi:ATP synthase protein I
MAANEQPSPEKHRVSQEQDLIQQVGKKEVRKLRARREQHRAVWFWLGMVGLVGWSVAIPTIIGIALGIWIDRTWPSRYSWTLMLLLLGVAVGCMNAWSWIRQESGRD